MPTLVVLNYCYFKMNRSPHISPRGSWKWILFWLTLYSYLLVSPGYAVKSPNWVFSIYSWLPASQFLPFAWGIDECIGGGVIHLEGREELGRAPVGTSCTKRLQGMGSLASISLFCVHALCVISGPGYVRLCAWELGGLWAKGRC